MFFSLHKNLWKSAFIAGFVYCSILVEDEAEASSSKIEELSVSIAMGEKYLADATTLRKKNASDFAATETGLADIIYTMKTDEKVFQEYSY